MQPYQRPQVPLVFANVLILLDVLAFGRVLTARKTAEQPWHV